MIFLSKYFQWLFHQYFWGGQSFCFIFHRISFPFQLVFHCLCKALNLYFSECFLFWLYLPLFLGQESKLIFYYCPCFHLHRPVKFIWKFSCTFPWRTLCLHSLKQRIYRLFNRLLGHHTQWRCLQQLWLDFFLNFLALSWLKQTFDQSFLNLRNWAFVLRRCPHWNWFFMIPLQIRMKNWLACILVSDFKFQLSWLRFEDYQEKNFPIV